jgi:hypothetical protein
MRWRPHSRQFRRTPDLADLLHDAAGGTPGSIWVGGVAAPIALALYSLSIFISGTASMIGGRPTRIVEYSGTPAICLGICWLGVAIVAHAHWFWSWREWAHGYAQLGKLCGMALAVGAFVGFVGTAFVRALV